MVQLRDSSRLQGLMMVGGGVIPKGITIFLWIEATKNRLAIG
jgi:hypothetical protein